MTSSLVSHLRLLRFTGACPAGRGGRHRGALRRPLARRRMTRACRAWRLLLSPVPPRALRWPKSRKMLNHRTGVCPGARKARQQGVMVVANSQGEGRTRGDAGWWRTSVPAAGKQWSGQRGSLRERDTERERVCGMED
jgi:hypothetical protein